MWNIILKYYVTNMSIFLQAGGNSCFNTMCPGFVMVNPHPISSYTLRETHPGATPTIEFGIFIFRVHKIQYLI